MALGTCAQPQKKPARKEDEQKRANPFTSKKDSADALFEIMDTEGRGRGNREFWETKTHKEKIGYCKWLIKKREVESRSEFTTTAAPIIVANYVRNNNLWDEVGLGDKRKNNKYCGKQKNDSTESSKAQAPGTPKKHSANLSFEIMDAEGRGGGSRKFWETTTREEKIDYCKWLIEEKGVKTRTEFATKAAPTLIASYIINNKLWDKIGLPDTRIGSKSNSAHKNDSGEASKEQAPGKNRGQARFWPRLFSGRTGTEGKEPSTHDPHSPLATPQYASPAASPRRMPPPLPELKFRHWKRVPESERAVMIGEYFEATRKGELSNLEKLLRMGVPVDVRNSRGETALMEAAFWRHTKTCQTLLEHGANPRLKNRDGENALVYAKEGERPETIELIRNAIIRGK